MEIPTTWQTRINAFVLQEVRCYYRDPLECTAGHVQERMDNEFGTKYHFAIWRQLLEAIGA
jgi:transposase